MSGSSEHAVPQKQRIALIVVLLGAAYLAISLHRNGHTQGDDFALYIRQARSLFEGDSAAVIADNRFAVLNSDPAFSPIGYPWGWPVILAPFVHFWGYGYDRLKLVVVALFCVWLLLLHGVVRRRVGRWPALGIVAAFGTAPAFLAHTDQLTTEIPHLAAGVVFLWLFDRVTSRSTLIGAPTRDLVMLGVAAAVVFNVRREGLVLAVVMAAIQLYDLFMRDVAIGEYDVIDLQAGNQRRQLRFRKNVYAIGIERACQGGWISPFGNSRDLRSSKRDHLVCRIMSVHDVEVVKVATGRAHDQNPAPFAGFPHHLCSVPCWSRIPGALERQSLPSSRVTSSTVVE